MEPGSNVSMGRTHRRSPTARDWPEPRKHFTAVVTCINTALIGIIVGIYAGEVPAIQYAIVDQSHYTILGNVVFFAGMAIPLLLFYPLPMLHGRKPYTLAGLAMLMPLLFPQALATEFHGDVSVARYRAMLLIPRGLAGIAAGFVEINLMPTLLDLFGSSLQSTHPHGEVVDENDVRRHGGGMGAWLSIWTWCAIGSIGFGFFLGAAITAGGWMVEYLVNVRNGDVKNMGYVPAGFYGGGFLGRLILAEPTYRLGERRMIFIYAVLCVGLQLVFWLYVGFKFSCEVGSRLLIST